MAAQKREKKSKPKRQPAMYEIKQGLSIPHIMAGEKKLDKAVENHLQSLPLKQRLAEMERLEREREKEKKLEKIKARENEKEEMDMKLTQSLQAIPKTKKTGRRRRKKEEGRKTHSTEKRPKTARESNSV